MSVPSEGRWSNIIADSVLKRPQLLKFQRGIGVVGVYSTKSGWSIIVGRCRKFEKFPPIFFQLFTSQE